ncbi:hypothetical protein NHX12_021445 [Muraenolepis orangiensis]|uniref:Uncharacterized protein n=1 Tax=Muraenolepis orangiensis TaxID=630683 RepID=A0A9Q0EQ35_9TELE|nr:hypothetical protein NHX12_021445 [Muraenolepis orangiensis]
MNEMGAPRKKGQQGSLGCFFRVDAQERQEVMEMEMVNSITSCPGLARTRSRRCLYGKPSSGDGGGDGDQLSDKIFSSWDSMSLGL